MHMQMAKYRLFLAALGGLAALGCDPNFFSGSGPCDPEANYPASISKLSDVDYLALKAEFDSLNKNYFLSTTIDYFGFLISAFPYSRPPGLMTKEQADAYLTRLKATLVEFSSFTNVTSTSQLKVVSDDWRGEANSYGVRFAPQTIDGLQVFNSALSVAIFVDGSAYIKGRWYGQVIVPECNVVSKDEAILDVLGTTVQHSGIAGDLHTQEVVKENIGPLTKMILPLESGDDLTLHVVWRISYYRNWWYLYVDTTTGRLLHIQTNVIG